MASVIEQGLAFIERCSATGAAAAAADFCATIKRVGFSGSACGAWAGVGPNCKARFLFRDWPPDWLDFHQTNGFFEQDLLPMEARRRPDAFWYSSIIGRFRPSEQQTALHEAGVAYGWKDVFTVPIHEPGSVHGFVAMATRQALKLGAADCAVLEAIARALWMRCRACEGFGLCAPERTHLSPRELECLRWAAAGKSDSDIAVLVGIRPATAHFHIEQAKKRLGVKTRVEAVAVGVLNGML